jgi:hypothetical protein
MPTPPNPPRRRHDAESVRDAYERLTGWTARTQSVIAVAAMLSREKPTDGLDEPLPQLLLAIEAKQLCGAELALMIAQLDVATVMVLNRVSGDTDLDEEDFLAIYRAARKHLMQRYSDGLCGACDGEWEQEEFDTDA